MSLREPAVERDRALEHLPRELDILHAERAEVLPAAQVHLVRLRIRRAGPPQSATLIGRDAQPQRGDDRFGDLLLDRERVLDAAVVAVRPELVPIAADEAGADAQVVVDLADASLEQRPDAKRARHDAHVGRLAFELERGAS